jgi:protein TonB
MPPPIEYPRASRKLREAGRVIVRVYVDEAGMPRVTQVKRSSGFVRLDDAALEAVQKARFKPYIEHGMAVAGWALIPLDFDLEL